VAPLTDRELSPRVVLAYLGTHRGYERAWPWLCSRLRRGTPLVISQHHDVPLVPGVAPMRVVTTSFEGASHHPESGGCRILSHSYRMHSAAR
jgi:hypothetical protein